MAVRLVQDTFAIHVDDAISCAFFFFCYEKLSWEKLRSPFSNTYPESCLVGRAGFPDAFDEDGVDGVLERDERIFVAGRSVLAMKGALNLLCAHRQFLRLLPTSGG